MIMNGLFSSSDNRREGANRETPKAEIVRVKTRKDILMFAAKRRGVNEIDGGMLKISSGDTRLD